MLDQLMVDADIWYIKYRKPTGWNEIHNFYNTLNDWGSRYLIFSVIDLTALTLLDDNWTELDDDTTDFSIAAL